MNNMTSQEKAIELVDKYYPILGGIEPKDWEYFCKDKAKECALTAVNEILKSVSCVNWLDEGSINFKPFFDYWQEVKQEIEKL